MKPREIVGHEHLFLMGDARLILDETTRSQLAARGDDVPVPAEYDQPSTIPQHHAATPEELAEYVDAYTRLASRFGLHALFRGQTRDYFSDDILMVLPAGFRSEGGAFSRGLVRAEWVETQLMPWLNCLGEICGIDLGTCLKFMPVADEWGVCRWITTRAKHLTGSSLGVIALLQHYGFPTYFLDVTPQESVAAWFALNRAVTAESGPLTFEPLAGIPVARRDGRRSAAEIADAPCVHVYLQARDDEHWPVLDLRLLPGLGEAALRPNRQEAFFLPFMVTDVDRISTRVLDRQCTRSPTALIKLYFGASDFQRIHPELSADHLLPQEDPLYGALWDQRVPKLTDVGAPRSSTPGETWRALVRKALPARPADEPRPGSVQAEAPNVPIAHTRAAAVLKAASVPYRGSSMMIAGVVFWTEPGQEIPPDVNVAIRAISEELNVPIALLPEDDDPF